ncbi:MAG: DNA adenine methylase, partial [Spirochaetales bacterium]|nr:DNA adenine methylase [Spirochaetales bacterium]
MYNHPFLTKQLIAYIGNKRTLLPFLSSVFDGFDIKHKISFLDPFAGSGAVSRLGKFKGYRVSTNDWESYSYVFNSCFIGVNKSNSLFEKSGGIKKIFNDINSLNAPFTPYISKHYAPESTNEADYITERLFYTKENAVFIDRARSYIEDLYPES